MFEQLVYLCVAGFLLRIFLRVYLFSLYRRYRGDPYWQSVKPYKLGLSLWWLVLLFWVLAYYFAVQDRVLVFVFHSALVALLLALAWLDLKLRILPDALLLLLFVLGLSYRYVVLESDLLTLILLAVLCGVCAKIVQMACQSSFFERISQAFGAGDVKFIIALLAWVDITQLPYVLLIACVAALCTVWVLSVFRRVTLTHIAFGPFLGLGTYVILMTAA